MLNPVVSTEAGSVEMSLENLATSRSIFRMVSLTMEVALDSEFETANDFPENMDLNDKASDLVLMEYSSVSWRKSSNPFEAWPRIQSSSPPRVVTRCRSTPSQNVEINMAVLACVEKAVFNVPRSLVDLVLCSMDSCCHAITSGHLLESMISAANSKLACEAHADNCMRYSAKPDTSVSRETHFATSGVGEVPSHFSDLAKTSLWLLSDSPYPSERVELKFPNWPPTIESLGIAPLPTSCEIWLKTECWGWYCGLKLGTLPFFFARCCLGKVPGGAPFSQLHKGIGSITRTGQIMQVYKPKQIQAKQRQQQISNCGGREDETDARAVRPNSLARCIEWGGSRPK